MCTAKECVIPSSPHLHRFVLPPFEGHKNPIVILTTTLRGQHPNLMKSIRWHSELFFGCIKQHLHMTAFLSNSPNVILNQFYAALILAFLLAYLRALNFKSTLATPLHLFRKLRNALFHPIDVELFLLGFLFITVYLLHLSLQLYNAPSR